MSPIRGLTQSEKHRLYVEVPEDENTAKLIEKHGSRPKVVGSRVLECPRNTIEERKLKKHLAKLEHERQRKEAELTTQKHMLRMDHKNFLGASHLMPGFRFHRNGDTKGGHRDSRKPAPLTKKSASTPILQNRVISANRLLLSEQIEALKKELRLLKSSKSKVPSSVKESFPTSRLQTNKAYLRAHTNDSPFNKPGALSPSSSPRKNEEKVDVSAERFSRKSSKPNCIACECTFHNTDALEATERKKIQELKLKWRSPPKGYFLKSMSSAQVLSPSSTASGDAKSKKALQASSSLPLGKKSHRPVPLNKTMSGPPNSPSSQLPPPAKPPPRRLVSPELLSRKGKKSTSAAEVVRTRREVEDDAPSPGKKLRAISRSSPGLNRQVAQHRSQDRRIHSPGRIKSQMERDEEILRGKVQSFVASLPASKPAISKWRPVCRSGRQQANKATETLNDDQSAASTSKTRVQNVQTENDEHDEDNEDEDQQDADSITWSRYNLSPTGASHIMSDIYLANVNDNANLEVSSKCSEAPLDDNNDQEKAFAELLNCRYLRIPKSVQRAWE